MSARSVGLVLGAGGPLGWVYHLGVLAAVRAHLGLEPGDAARIVGTSAGAAIAASALAGAGTDQILTAVTTPPTEAEMAEMRRAAAEFRSPRRWFRPTAPSMLGRVGSSLRSGDGLGFGVLAGLVPAGVFPTVSLRRFPVAGLDGTWPDNLWIPSVRADDGRVIVFGRDVMVPVVDAVEATAAVPAMFQPKVIDGHRYLDGAVRSATNADLLVGHPVDLVIVASPMTRPGSGVIRTRARCRLRRETQLLAEAGVTVAVVEPSAALVELATGFPRSRADDGPRIVAAAADEVGRELRRFT